MARVALLLTLLGVACARDAQRATSAADAAARREITAGVAQYAAAAKAVDPNSSALFTRTGTLFEPGIAPIVSPDSIRAFIMSFPGVKVDSAVMTADTIEVFDGTAFVWGSYFEKLSFPGQPQSSQHGKFVMEWRREADGRWRIERYYRVPLPESWKPPPAAALRDR